MEPANIYIKSVTKHPRNIEIGQDIDLCVIELKSSFSGLNDLASRGLAMLNLPDSDFILPINDLAIVSGWANQDGNVYTKPRSAYVKVIGYSECNEIYQTNNITQKRFCAGDAYQYPDNNLCVELPGSPLQYENTLIGVASWGFRCGDIREYPVVYTDVALYSEWIYNKIHYIQISIRF